MHFLSEFLGDGCYTRGDDERLEEDSVPEGDDVASGEGRSEEQRGVARQQSGTV